MAFVTDDGKYKSAKIVNRSSKNQMFKLQTSYGREFKVPYSSIIWVKTGDRWPKGIYKLLKGITDGSERDAEKEEGRPAGRGDGGVLGAAG